MYERTLKALGQSIRKTRDLLEKKEKQFKLLSIKQEMKPLDRLKIKYQIINFFIEIPNHDIQNHYRHEIMWKDLEGSDEDIEIDENNEKMIVISTFTSPLDDHEENWDIKVMDFKDFLKIEKGHGF